MYPVLKNLLPLFARPAKNICKWNIEDTPHFDSRIIIYQDGTFDLLEGSFAAIGMGSGSDGSIGVLSSKNGLNL